MKFTVIGIDDSHGRRFDDEIMSVIGSARFFSGGRRHRGIVGPYLPESSVWVDITVPLSDVFRRYGEAPEWVVFASGDPLFFGFANTLKREFPDAEIRLFPVFNSLQTLAHKLVMPYHDMRTVSLTGREWGGLDRAVIEGSSMIGLLTDSKKGPAEIAKRLLEFGYDNYVMFAGELLGNAERERIRRLSLEEAAASEFCNPNCVILERTAVRLRRFGIRDEEFEHLAGRSRMITKMPVRLAALSMLGLHGRRCMLDIGFCTGSVSIEAKLQFPHLAVVSFEVRGECAGIIAKNMRRFGVPGIDVRMGDFLAADPGSLPHPDAVFIGGHGGRLAEITERIAECAEPGGVVVMNAVSEESRRMFAECAGKLGWECGQPLRVAVDDYNPIWILSAKIR